MKKYTYTQEMTKVEHVQVVCDTCGKKLSIGNNGMMVREMGNPYPLQLRVGDTDYDFCSYKCLLNFIVEELKKETK
jgi:hypothetical protein